MAGRRMGVPIWAGLSIALMLIGAFGPWVKVLGISVNGTDGSNDGWLVVGAAVLAALFLYPYVRYSGSRWLPALVALCGIAAVATTIHDRRNVTTKVSGAAASVVEVGWGLNVALIASISLVLAAAVLFFRPNVKTSGSDETASLTKVCPDCAETVLEEARVCKHCGYRFDEAIGASRPTKS